MSRLLRRAFDGAAVVSAVLFINGCIIIPLPEGRWAKHNQFEGQIGGPDSSAPIRVGASDRSRVLEVLGRPWNIYEKDVNSTGWLYAR